MTASKRSADQELAGRCDAKRTRSDTVEEDSRFLSLPAEIRLQIYGHLLPDVPVIPARLQDVRTAVHNMQTVMTRGYLRSDNAPCQTAILRTNRFTFTEAFDLVYKNRTMTIEFDPYPGPATCLVGFAIHDDVATAALHRFQNIDIAINLMPIPNIDRDTHFASRISSEGVQYRSLKGGINTLVCSLVNHWIPRRRLQITCRCPQIENRVLIEAFTSTLRPFRCLWNIEEVQIVLVWEPLPGQGTTGLLRPSVPEELQQEMDLLVGMMKSKYPSKSPVPLVPQWMGLVAWLKTVGINHRTFRVLNTMGPSETRMHVLQAWTAYDEGDMDSFQKMVKVLKYDHKEMVNISDKAMKDLEMMMMGNHQQPTS